MGKLALVVIDGQNDFCADGTEPDGRRGALCVEGAAKEASNVANLIERLGSNLDAIFVTLDSHQRNDCSHNVAWEDKDGNTPPPFTVISPQDIHNGLYKPRYESVFWDNVKLEPKDWAYKYALSLEANDRPSLCLWPVHCQIGTWGNNVYPKLNEAYDSWCKETNKHIDYVVKGTCPYTEHYSAFCAEVTSTSHPETQFNQELRCKLLEYDQILWTGWAGSHCYRFSILSYIKWPCDPKKCVLMEDACAAVPDIPGAPFKFSDWRTNFLMDLQNEGATINNTKDFQP